MINKYFIPGPEKVHEVSDDEFGPPERKLLMLEDDVDTACVLKEYLETVVKERDDWKDLYRACRELV